jgi:ubiquinone/menaquinone biosynthesis C-methylase UbiE
MELQRLMLQSQVLRPITERLLKDAGLAKGMRVLDLGCGPGDVSLLAAEIVGPMGSVVGIDRAPEAVATARERARRDGLRQIEYQVTSVEDFSPGERFDLVIGRYVLIHQTDPAAFISAAARHVRLGGTIAFHEISLHHRCHSLPLATVWDDMAQWLDIAFRAAAPSWDAAGRLVEHFLRAGLPYPVLFAEMPVGGGENSPLYAWMAATLRSLMPLLLGLGAVTEEDVAIDTLERRVRASVVAAKAQVDVPSQVCAWTKL